MSGFTYRSKNGKWYNNMVDKMEADRAWDIQRAEQEEQNRLLEEQNQLMQKQLLEKNKLEREKIESNIKLEKEKMGHEEKMRILKLLDDIGLNKNVFDEFVNYLTHTNRNNIILLLNEEIKEAENQIYNIDKFFENPEENFDYVEDLVPSSSLDKTIDIIKNMKKYLKEPKKPENINYIKSYFTSNPNDEYLLYETDSKKGIRNFLILFVLAFLSLFISISIVDIFNSALPVFIGVFLDFIFIIIAIHYLKKSNNLSYIVNKVLDELTKEFNNEVKNIRKELLETKEDNEKSVKHYKDEVKRLSDNTEVSNRWEDFVNFRKKHYNQKIENLLLEVGLKEKIEELGIKYIRINNNNKINDGSIEDYIIYFDKILEEST